MIDLDSVLRGDGSAEALVPCRCIGSQQNKGCQGRVGCTMLHAPESLLACKSQRRRDNYYGLTYHR